MQPVIIYDYFEFAPYFRDFVNERKHTQPAFSTRYLCKRTGIKSPAIFSWFASGKRVPSQANLEALKEICNWNPIEFEYANKMILLARSRSDEESEALKEAMRKMKPLPSQSLMSHDANEFTCMWYNNAILLLFSLPDASADPKWIVKRLGNAISEELANEAVERMLRLGLLENVDGNIRKTHKHIKINSEASSIRDFHQQLLDIAGEALESQRPKERPFFGYTVSLKKAQIGEASEFLEKMIGEFIKRFCSDSEPDQVYHLAIQLFQLSQSLEAQRIIEEEM